MKHKLFFSLIEKEVTERFRGVGAAALAVRVLLVGGLAAAFVWFYTRFAAVYTEIGEDGAARTFELLSLSLAALFLLMTAGSAASAVRSVRLAEDLPLFAALPVSRGMLLAAKLVCIYCGQLFVSAIALPVFAHVLSLRGLFSVAAILLLPALAVACGMLLAFPFHAVLRFLRGKFLLSFLFGTALFALGLYGYSLLLGGVKEVLLGGDLKYFFGEKVLSRLALAVKYAYPANLFARALLGQSAPLPALFCISLFALPLGGLLARGLLSGAFRVPSAPEPRLRAGGGRRPVFFALLAKEFVTIFRTPAYAFSYFSVAVVMPLMVYFCMSVGGSLLERLLGVDCSFELALLLTLLYSALTNVFCASNISREGKMFLVSKAMPVSAGQVFAAKVLLSMLVVAFALLASSAALYFAGYLSLGAALTVLLFGLAFSFAQVCFSIKYDFSHPRFPVGTEEAGEGDAVSLVWLALALAIGGGSLALRLLTLFRFGAPSLPYAGFAAGGCCFLAALLSALYLFLHLRRRYDAFAGGDR